MKNPNKQEIKLVTKWRKINELKKKKESLEEVFKSYTSHKGETWNKVKLHVSEAIKELKEAINVIVTKKD